MDNRRIIELKQQLVTHEGLQNELSEKFKKKKSNSSTGNVLILFAVICLVIGFAVPPVWAIFILLLIISIVMMGYHQEKVKLKNNWRRLIKKFSFLLVFFTNRIPFSEYYLLLVKNTSKGVK